MKYLNKILLAIVMMAMGVGMANAELRFGVKAGMLVNKLSLNQDIMKANNSCGWTAGALVEYTVPIIGINVDAGLMYARMNNSTEVTGLTVDNDLYGKNFLEIPINLKYKFTIPMVASIIKPYLFTGPNIAFRLDKSITDDINDIKSRTCQVAWNIGLGVELIRHLQVAASYGFGINNIVSKATDKVTPTQIKAKNNYWTVSAAWLF